MEKLIKKLKVLENKISKVEKEIEEYFFSYYKNLFISLKKDGEILSDNSNITISDFSLKWDSLYIQRCNNIKIRFWGVGDNLFENDGETKIVYKKNDTYIVFLLNNYEFKKPTIDYCGFNYRNESTYNEFMEIFNTIVDDNFNVELKELISAIKNCPKGKDLIKDFNLI